MNLYRVKIVGVIRMIEIYDAHCTPGDIPRFSWKLRGNCQQTGYRIFVQNKLGNKVWDSDFRQGKERHNVGCEFYLEKGEIYKWKVKCYGSDGSEDSVEGNTFFSKIPEWKARWIEPGRDRKPLMDNIMPHSDMTKQADPIERLDPAIYMRKPFSLDCVPKQAIAYATAHGIYAL